MGCRGVSGRAILGGGRGNSLLPPAHPPASISWGVCGVQPRMLPLSRHRGFPPGVCTGCQGDLLYCPHPGQAGGPAWIAGASASSERHCQLSATSLLRSNLQPWQDWLRQPRMRNKRLLTGDVVLRKAPGSCPATSGASCRSPCRRAGGMLLPAAGGPPPHTSSCGPQTPAHPSCLSSPVPRAALGRALPSHHAPPPRCGQHRPRTVAVPGCQAWGRGWARATCRS